MKHTMLTFRLHLRGVVLAALGALLAAALLLVGGCLLGQWRAGRTEAAAAAPAGGTGAAGTAAAGAASRAASARVPSTGAGVARPRVPGASTAATGTARAARAGAAGAGAASGGPASGSAAAPTASAAEPPPGMPERYTLRVGAFPTEEEAKALADRLTMRGYAPTLGQVESSTGAILQLVYVGSYGTLWEARGAASEIERREAREGLQAVVVPAPQ